MDQHTIRQVAWNIACVENPGVEDSPENLKNDIIDTYIPHAHAALKSLVSSLEFETENDPIDNLAGVVEDLKANKTDNVDIETLERVIKQLSNYKSKIM